MIKRIFNYGNVGFLRILANKKEKEKGKIIFFFLNDNVN